jgi:hypothetical protein
MNTERCQKQSGLLDYWINGLLGWLAPGARGPGMKTNGLMDYWIDGLMDSGGLASARWGRGATDRWIDGLLDFWIGCRQLSSGRSNESIIMLSPQSIYPFPHSSIFGLHP